MTRSVSAAYEAALEAIRTGPIWFIEIGLTSTVRYTSAEAAITYNGNTYDPQDFRVQNLTIGNAGANSAEVSFQGVDNVFTALFRQGDAEGSTVKIWVSDQKLASHTSADDAIQLIESTIDQQTLTPKTITQKLERQIIWAPNKRCDAEHGFNDVTAPGPAQFPAGTQVLS